MKEFVIGLLCIGSTLTLAGTKAFADQILSYDGTKLEADIVETVAYNKIVGYQDSSYEGCGPTSETQCDGNGEGCGPVTVGYGCTTYTIRSYQYANSSFLVDLKMIVKADARILNKRDYKISLESDLNEIEDPINNISFPIGTPKDAHLLIQSLKISYLNPKTNQSCISFRFSDLKTSIVNGTKKISGTIIAEPLVYSRFLRRKWSCKP